MNNETRLNRSASFHLFLLGEVVATPGALDLLDRTATNAHEFLRRHQHGDWGSVPPEDAEENQISVETGCRINQPLILKQVNDKASGFGVLWSPCGGCPRSSHSDTQ